MSNGYIDTVRMEYAEQTKTELDIEYPNEEPLTPEFEELNGKAVSFSL